MKKPLKALSLVLVAAAALVLLFGMPSSASEGAGTAIVIDGTTNTWEDVGPTILLEDGDILTILAAAGSPAVDTVIMIAVNANVVINGTGATIDNLRIAEGADTQEHTVTLNSLWIKAVGAEGYIHSMGVIKLIGDNVINGNGNTAVYSANVNPLKITSTNNGTLNANGGTQVGIFARSLNIDGSAKVTALSSGAGTHGVVIDKNAASIYVAADASLTASASNGGNGINFVSEGLKSITVNGTITATSIPTGKGIFSIGDMAITGTGTVVASAFKNGLMVNTLTIDKTSVTATSSDGDGLSTMDATPVSITNGGVLIATGQNAANIPGKKGFMMSPGSTVILWNLSKTSEEHLFTVSAEGNQWLLSGDATFVDPDTAISSPANISIAAGKKGTVLAASPPGITGPATMTLAYGYTAVSSDAFTLTGIPTPIVVTSGDAKITWNAGTKKLDIAAGLAPGSYVVGLTASNGATPEATATFTLTVSEPVGGDGSGINIWLLIGIVLVIIIVVGYVVFKFFLTKKGAKPKSKKP